MKTTTNLPIPVIKALRKMGQDINDARRRRRITIELMAERAGLSQQRLEKLKKAIQPPQWVAMPQCFLSLEWKGV